VKGVRFEVLLAVVSMIFFWVVPLCNLVDRCATLKLNWYMYKKVCGI